MEITIQNVTSRGERAYEGDSNRHIINLCKTLAKNDFLFLQPTELCDVLSITCFRDSEHWKQFQSSFTRLPHDDYMADGGQYRQRRHAVYRTEPGRPALIKLEREPHYQAIEDNILNGGIPRHFAPIEEQTCNNFVMIHVLNACRDLFSAIAPFYHWRIEVHQFRIITSDLAAYPTPEGLHRDGVNFVFMMLVSRENITGGETSIHSRLGAPLDRHTFISPMEAAILNDEWATHSVSPIMPANPGIVGYRDMLVITFRKD